jgi:superfamily I DNA/RNA helicase
MNLTKEQQAVIECDHRSVLISAFAGTGKTTTLRAFAEARPRKRALLIVFNRDAAQSIRQIMPGHVDVQTSHAIAYKAIARDWRREKLIRSPSAYYIRDVGIARDFEQARYIKDAINAFCFSNALDIEQWARGYYAQKSRDLSLRIDERSFVDGLLKLWGILVDPRSEVGLHDAYFKLWQMSRPKLNYDVIMVDEAQDTNDALLDVINFQQHAQRIVVGDSHQAIYGFRGAKDIMSLINGHHLYLTESFRFSSPIAELATDLLTVFKGERKSLKGVAGWQSNVLMPGEKTPDTGKKAIICRTNAAVFAEAAEACEKNKRVNVNIPDAALDEIVDAYYIFDGRRSQVKNSLMKKFNSFIEMLDYAESSGDRELMMRCKVVERYRDAIPELVQKIRKSQDASAQLTITTAHRAKGLEWDHVALCDDFPELMRGDEPAAGSTDDPEDYVLAAEEANLYYVAITRARQTLVLNEQLRNFNQRDEKIW